MDIVEELNALASVTDNPLFRQVMETAANEIKRLRGRCQERAKDVELLRKGLEFEKRLNRHETPA